LKVLTVARWVGFSILSIFEQKNAYQLPNMNESKKWKSRLLSSSLPLEYEVAKILTDRDFSVSFDYSYYRKDANQKKEFSTDLKGLHFFPLDTEDRIDASLTLLAECKYREEGKKWIFLPDINKPEFSDFTLGYTIKSLAEFSKAKTKRDLITSFEDEFEFALKGVEINLTSGEVFDKDIRHGIAQLKFALPYLIKSTIEGNTYCHLADAKPAYIISVLVTNADLYILDDAFSIERVKECEDLNELTQHVPFLVCHSEIGPDFTDHHKEIFQGFSMDCEDIENLKIFEAFQKTQKDKKHQIYYSPLGCCHDLEQSYLFTMKKYYSQHFICNFKHFPEFIDKILNTLAEVTKPDQKKTRSKKK